MQKGDVFRHFKGFVVYIVDIATDSESLEEVAIYHHLNSDDRRIWVRPVKMFSEAIDSNREGNINKQDKRFVKIDLNKE